MTTVNNVHVPLKSKIPLVSFLSRRVSLLDRGFQLAFEWYCMSMSWGVRGIRKILSVCNFSINVVIDNRQKPLACIKLKGGMHNSEKSISFIFDLKYSCMQLTAIFLD